MPARRGDKRGFVEIVARHQAMVCRIALGILGDFAANDHARGSSRAPGLPIIARFCPG
jgi:hypothetical protein